MVLLFACCSKSPVQKERSKITAPFDGKKFDNLEPFKDKNFWTLMKWRLGSDDDVKWPEEIETKLYKPKLKRTDESTHVYVINHATVLIQMRGINILTDPIYSERSSPVSFMGPKRVRKPGILFKDLPKIDYVLISHNHYDHLDIETLKELQKRDDPLIIAGLGNQALLKSENITNVKVMDWWEDYKIQDITLHFVPSQHWSARTIWDKRETLWGGYYLTGPKYKIYFAGDTGYGKFFKTIKEKLGAPDLALLPIGAYEPRWFMKPAHMNPAESVMAFQDLAAKKAIGIHFGTFKLTNEGIDQPMIDLTKAIKKNKIPPGKFITPEFGQQYQP